MPTSLRVETLCPKRGLRVTSPRSDFIQLTARILSDEISTDFMITNVATEPSRRLRLAGIAAALVLLVQPVQGAMRCGSELVSHGDHKIEVLHKCGQPALVEPRGYQHYSYQPHYLHGSRQHFAVYADIEEWTYNFGPRRFMRLVRFADSKVVRIISLDYGY